MKTPATAPRSRAPQPAVCNDCPNTSIAGALHAQADALKALVDVVQPVAKMCIDAGDRMDKAGKWVRRKALLLLWTSPLVLTGLGWTVQADLLNKFIKALSQ